jgi:hypothetical protein
MSGAESLFVRDGDQYVGTSATRGGWYDNEQSGGAVLALLGHVLEDVATLSAMSLTRLTVDIVRPVPVGAPLHVATRIVREGKKIQVVDLTVVADDIETTHARALRIRDLDLTPYDGVPVSTSTANPAALLPPPERFESVEHREGVAEFLQTGAELRRTVGPIDGMHAVWCRLRVPVVAGEPTRASSRAAVMLDLVNLLGVDLDRSQATSINPDVSGHMSRGPVGEWVALSGNTYYSPTTGHGVSTALMSDEAGVFGTTSTSQIVQPVAR